MDYAYTPGDTFEISGIVKRRKAGAESTIEAAAIAQVRFTVKRKRSDADADAITQKSLGSGITVAAGTNEVKITVPPAGTAAWPADTPRLYYDVQVTEGDGNSWTSQRGFLVRVEDVTDTP